MSKRRLISDLKDEHGAGRQFIDDRLREILNLTRSPGLKALKSRKLDLARVDPGKPLVQRAVTGVQLVLLSAGPGHSGPDLIGANSAPIRSEP